jgi:hypothetical protein
VKTEKAERTGHRERHDAGSIPGGDNLGCEEAEHDNR